MSGESELTAPGLEPAQDPAPVAATEPAAPPADDDVPEAVEVTPGGEKMVPLSALISARQEIKQLKPLAKKATESEAELNQLRPYAEFVKANQQLLQPQIQPPVQQSTEPDPELVDFARTIELYDPATGQPDTKRASKILERTNKQAAVIAQQAIAPLQDQSNESRAVTNLNTVLASKDAHGQPITSETVTAVMGQLAQGLMRQGHQNPRAEMLRLLADPQVAELIIDKSYRLQSANGRPAQLVPKPGPALEVETAGGSERVNLSEHSKRLMRDAGISEKDAVESAKRYKPGRSNVLE